MSAVVETQSSTEALSSSLCGARYVANGVLALFEAALEKLPEPVHILV